MKLQKIQVEDKNRAITTLSLETHLTKVKHSCSLDEILLLNLHRKQKYATLLESHYILAIDNLKNEIANA